MTPEEQREVRNRQRSRSIVVGLLLGALVILFYAIAIAKIASH